VPLRTIEHRYDIGDRIFVHDIMRFARVEYEIVNNEEPEYVELEPEALEPEALDGEPVDSDMWWEAWEDVDLNYDPYNLAKTWGEVTVVAWRYETIEDGRSRIRYTVCFEDGDHYDAGEGELVYESGEGVYHHLNPTYVLAVGDRVMYHEEFVEDDGFHGEVGTVVASRLAETYNTGRYLVEYRVQFKVCEDIQLSPWVEDVDEALGRDGYFREGDEVCSHHYVITDGIHLTRA
jgi:hypothetical protein